MVKGAILGVFVLLCAAGCTHARSTSGTSNLAAAVEMPAETPPWLIRQARRTAVQLGDAHPDRVRIRLGRVAVIEVWGDFVCDCGNSRPGSKPMHGFHA